MGTWEDIRKEVRRLENEIDVKLVSYTKLGTSYTQPGHLREGSDTNYLGPTENVATSMSLEIEQLLMKLSEMNEHLRRSISALSDGPPTNNLIHVLQHHRSKLADFSTEFRRVRTNIKAAREHAELLSSVRHDINEHKTAANVRQESLLRERNSLHNAERTADLIIQQSYETRDSLGQQRSILSNAVTKLENIAGTYGGIGALMNSIRRRQSRDCLIITALIAVLSCFMVWYAIRR